MIPSVPELRRLTYQAKVRTVFVETFGLTEPVFIEQEQTWKEWCDLQRNPNGRNLLECLKSDFNDVFKARALCILLAPDDGYAPFYWPESTKSISTLWGEIQSGEFSEKLLSFATDLALRSLEVVRNKNQDLSQSYACFLIHLLEYLRQEDLVWSVLRALPVCDFVRPVLDPWDLDGSPSVLKLFWLLMSAKIPEAWKRTQDEKVRKLIREEMSDPKNLKLAGNDAYPSYMEGVKLDLYGKSPSYSTELFASQVDFILGFETPGHRRFGAHTLVKFFERLSGHEYLSVRRRLVRDTIMMDRGQLGQFVVTNQEDFRLVKQALEEADPTDLELCSRLKQMILEAQPKILKETQDAREKSRHAEEVFEKMRR